MNGTCSTLALRNIDRQQHEFDVCVVGGGMAGVCAALAAARNGAKTAIVQDRPVFGGNASSEVRMWICGAQGPHNAETGILEELQLENLHRNPSGNYPLWDGILFGKVRCQPNLTPFLNASCLDAEMEGDRIVAIRAWQSPTQTLHTIAARFFIDCSGDSILAPLSGAEFRTGREARAEFGEDIEPEAADAKTMGSSILIQFRRTDASQPFVAPPWAWSISDPDELEYRIRGVNGHNFWWIELGGLRDTIRAAESLRDDLMALAYGVCDYIKNRAPERSEAENWALEWIGALPGKRESRRCVGDHILTQNDIRAEGRFPDVVAYGGWPMDDHHPAGILFPGKPTVFHSAPSPYGIPLRALYSRNIANLFFAGRNISATHAALSSTRVMATCAMMGQATGTAAAHCVRERCPPPALTSGESLCRLQQALLRDDCWLPGFRHPLAVPAASADLTGTGADLPLLLDGLDRDRPHESHAWSVSPGGHAQFEWKHPVHCRGVRIVFDSDLNHSKKLPCSYPDPKKMPTPLVRSYRIESRGRDGQWRPTHAETNNVRRLVTVPMNGETTGVRLVVGETWGGVDPRVFAFEPVEYLENPVPDYPPRITLAAIRSAATADDLAEPEIPKGQAVAYVGA